MSRRIHKFSDPEPRTTGSLRRAYRKNLRCDKPHGIRTDRIFSAENKVLFGLPPNADDCELWEIYLLYIEHGIRYKRDECLDPSMREIVSQLFKPLRPESYLRNVYKRLKERFDPQMRLPL